MPRRSCVATVATALALAACAGSPQASAAPARAAAAVWVTKRDGTSLRGFLEAPALHFRVDGEVREVPLHAILSLHMGGDASPHEQEIIARDIPLLAAADRQQAAVATDELLAIGLPVVTPLLKSFGDVDTDAHEPDSRYRLFARLLPAGADGKDRSLDMVRLVDGSVLRGRIEDAALELENTHPANGLPAHLRLPSSDLRRIAVAQDRVTRTFELHALHDCTYVDWLVTGIVPTTASTIRADAQGFVRLSFDEDGWATGPDGLFETLPGKRKLQEGFRWGCVLYRVGPAGQRRYAGSHLDAKNEDGEGMLQFAVNDNEHWQNNIGAYRVTVTVDNAFDTGPAH